MISLILAGFIQRVGFCAYWHSSKWQPEEKQVDKALSKKDYGLLMC